MLPAAAAVVVSLLVVASASAAASSSSSSVVRLSSSSTNGLLEDLVGPLFITEPPFRLDFSNSSGARLDCTAHGVPPPRITWRSTDGSPVSDVPRLRKVLSNGTVLFPPFKAEDYRQDVHANVYVCVAANVVGVAVSREVNVRGVAKQYYELQVYDEFVIVENTGVLRCHIPSFVEDYVTVSSWVREDGLVHNRDSNGGRFFLTASGDLYVSNVVSADSARTYQCKTLHRLTGETRLSSPGRIIVTDPKSSVPPRITHTKPLIQVQEGGSVELPCAAQGYPTPSYRWLRLHGKEVVPIQADSRVRQVLSLLVLDKAQMEDSGTYRCLVFNSMGEERTEIVVRVTALLSVHVSPQKQTVDVGKDTRLSCIINGFPVTSVSWLKNGRSLSTTERLRLPTREVLHIAPVEKEDKGVYQCMVANGEEMAQGTAEIKLGNVAPGLIFSFPEKPVHPGSPVALKCASFGNPSPEISWYVDDNALPPQPSFVAPTGEVTSFLNMSRVRLEDGGEYRCVAKNLGGSEEHAARLQVIGPPLVKPMKNVTAVAGKPILIKCRVTGHPLESITWEKDGNTLPMDHRQKILENGSLVINEVDRVSDQGMYTCVARNKKGLVSRNSLGLRVKVPPMIGPFSFPPVLHEGMRARLQCVVTQGDMPIVITWLKDERRVPADLGPTARQEDDFSSTLTFASINPRHSGRYTCIASNDAGTSNFTAPLVVDVPPRWLVQPSDASVVVKSQLRLDCRAEGYPEPRIIWKKAMGRFPENYADLNRTGSRYSLLSNGSLFFPTVAEEDEGYYLCHAMNGIGMGLSKVSHVTVQAAAYFEHKSRNQTAKRGDTVKLECRATGDSPITISWQSSVRDFFPKADSRFVVRDKPMTNGMLSEMTILNVERRDSGSYTCTASNTFGKDEMSTKLSVLEPPEAPENVKIVDHGSRSVKLLWSTPFDGSSPIAKYIIQYKNGSEEWASSLPNVTVMGHETSAVIRGLLPGTAYSFRVMAANDLGAGKASSGVGISTVEEAPASYPRDIQVVALSSDTLKVTCKPPLKSSWNGEIVGYVVNYKVHGHKDLPHVKSAEASADLSGEVVIDNLRKYTKYAVSVQAYNRMGRGPPSPDTVAYTAEDVPGSAPRNVQCQSVSSKSIQVSWDQPPPESQNGLIQGYKVLFVPVDGFDDSDDPTTSEAITNSDMKVSLFELKKYANYSIQVLAFTKIGNGVASDPVYCRTLEDVPSPPANVKVLAVSSDAIHVTWKPPLYQNGLITKYNVYMRALDENNKQTSKHVVSSPQQLFYEAKGLSENQRYEFWITANTRVGEGESTRVVSQKPTFKAAASIASFSEQVVIAWQHNATLECRALGMPTPSTAWTIRGEQLSEAHRSVSSAAEDSAIFIQKAQRTDAGNYSCTAENIYGKDEITYVLLILAPPLPPALNVVWETVSSIGIMWKQTGDGGSKVKGYILSYKQDYGKWQEVQLPAEDDKYALDNLLCGTRYQLYITAFNKVGVGEPSPVVSASTKGSPPLVPKQDETVMANATLLTVRLSSWPDGGCSIQYFVVEYRSRQQQSWILVSNNLAPQHEIVAVPELRPESWYLVRVTAHNEAGSTVALFEVATLAFAGGTVGPGVMVQTTNRPLPFYRDASIIVPVVVSSILTLSTIVGICLCMRRRKRPGGFRQDVGPQEKKAALGGTYDPARAPAGIRKIHPPMACDLSRGVHVTQGNAEDICPYATFRLPLRNNEVDQNDSYQLQTFPVGENHLADNQQRCDFRREDIYSKANKRSTTTKLPEEETLYKKEAPVDLRPFLSLSRSELRLAPSAGYQLPEYNDVSGCPDLGYQRHNCPQPTELAVEQTWDVYSKRGHRFPDLLYHGPESNSSDELSDDEDEDEPDQQKQHNWRSPKDPSQIAGWTEARQSYQTWRNPPPASPYDKRVSQRLLAP